MDYSYSLLKFQEDISTGESLNCGVVVHANGATRLRYVMCPDRLIAAFRHFNEGVYLSAMKGLAGAVNKFNETNQRFDDSGALMRDVWPDQGLAIAARPARHGVLGTESLDKVADMLFERFC